MSVFRLFRLYCITALGMSFSVRITCIAAHPSRGQQQNGLVFSPGRRVSSKNNTLNGTYSVTPCDEASGIADLDNLWQERERCW